MSYGFTIDGYKVKPLAVVLEEAFDRLHSIDTRISTTKGSWIWQVYKSKAMEYNELDRAIGNVADIINFDNAADWSLDAWGASYGVFRKMSTKATAIIKCTGLAVGYLIPSGSTFSSKKGISYETTIDEIIPSMILVTRSAVSTDSIPFPYSDVTSIAWINSNPAQTGTAYAETTDWAFDGDVITWESGHGPATGSIYYVGLEPDEDVSVTISAIALEEGSDSSISVGQITENTDGLGGVTSVTNEYSSIGGEDLESNANYRRRIKSLVNTQFGYQKIAQLTAELEPIRAAKCFQNTGVDVAYPDSGWDEAATWTSLETKAMYSTDDVIYGQTFVPTGDRHTIKGVSIYARKVGAPPPLRLKFYKWKTDYTTTVAGAPLSNKVFYAEDVDADDPTGWQEIQLPCRFGGLDYTKTYIFTIENDDDSSDVNNHWEFKYQGDGNEYADGGMYTDGSAVSNADIAFKTRWGGASYNLVVASLPGYDLVNYMDMIEALIIDFNSKAYSPICIQGNVIEATTAYINITATVFVDPSQDWDSVVADMTDNVASYVNGLGPGDNVVFSQVEYAIMRTTGVIKLLDCTIQRNDDEAITKGDEGDVLVADLEIAELDTGVHGPGVNFTQGSM